MKKGVSYGRVSSELQEENNSLPTQREGIRNYAAVHGIEIIEELYDIESGAAHDRPGLNRLRELVRQRAVNAVIFYCVDRVARDIALYYVLKDELKKASVELHYVTKGQIVDGVEGIISDGIDILMAQIERYRIQERFARGRYGKITGAGGKAPRIHGHGNNPPYGYKYEGHKATRELVIVESEAQVVKLIFTWYVEEKLSMAQIADRLTTMHIPTPGDGERQVANRVRGPGEWNKTSIARILHGNVYIGTMFHNKYRRAHKSPQVFNRPKDEWIGVTVSAIIEPEIWAAAQSQAQENAPMSRRNAKNFYLLGRRIRCQCGKSMYGKDDHGKLVYHCGGRDRQVAVKCSVVQKDIRARLVESIIWDWLTQQLQPEVLHEGITQIRGDTVYKQKHINDQIALLLRRRSDVDKERRKAVAAYQVDAISLDELKQSKELTDESFHSIDKELVRLEEQLKQNGPSEEELTSLMEFADKLHEELQFLTPQRRREVIDLLDLRIVVEVDSEGTQWGNVTCRLAADRLLLQKVASTSKIAHAQP